MARRAATTVLAAALACGFLLPGLMSASAQNLRDASAIADGDADGGWDQTLPATGVEGDLRLFGPGAEPPAGSRAAGRLFRYGGEPQTLSAEPVHADATGLLTATSVTFVLPEGATLRLLRDRVVERSPGDYSWIGHVESGYGLAVIVVRQGMITAQVQYGGRQFKLRPLGDGAHALFEEEVTAYPTETEDDGVPVPPDGKRSEGSRTAASSASSINCAVRVLVVYTDDVGSAHADPRGEIQLATDFFNVATATSLVAHEIELARVVELDYFEPSGGVNSGTALSELRVNGDGVWDEVHALRDLYDVDLVAGIFDNFVSSCGRAYLGPVPAAYSFGVNDYSCIAGNLTYAHELGHNYGARHDIYVDNSPGPAHGFAYPAGGWRTIMAYNRLCSDNGTFCQRLQFWSNPDRNHLGDPTGVAGESDNESTLDDNYALIAGIRAGVAAKVHDLADVVGAQEEANAYGLVTLATDPSAALTYESGSLGRLEAPDAVTLKPGFWAKAGANVTVRNRDCAATNARPAAARSVVTAEAPPRRLAGDGGFELRVAPNPVRVGAAVRLDYALPAEGFASLEVYAATGQPVETISYLPTQAAGAHRLAWTSTRLAAGSYVVVLRSAAGQRSARLVVVE